MTYSINSCNRVPISLKGDGSRSNEELDSETVGSSSDNLEPASTEGSESGIV